MSLSKKTFLEWIIFFVCINLGLLTILFWFVPMYSWWMPALLAVLVYFLAPTLINKPKK